jgi:hypothetical protein
MAPVTMAVLAAMRKLETMLLMATPPKIWVTAKMGMPLTRRAMTKKRRGGCRRSDCLFPG